MLICILMHPGLSSYKGPLARQFSNFILKVPFPSPGIMANLTQLHQPEPERSTGAGVNVMSSVFLSVYCHFIFGESVSFLSVV